MKFKPLLKPVLLYTCLLGLLTVGATYFVTHSGLYMLVLTVAGLVFIAIGGGTAGQVGTGPAEHSGEDWIESEASSWALLSPSNSSTSLRVALLFYGVGVLLWSLVVLTTLRDTLV